MKWSSCSDVQKDSIHSLPASWPFALRPPAKIRYVRWWTQLGDAARVCEAAAILELWDEALAR